MALDENLHAKPCVYGYLQVHGLRRELARETPGAYGYLQANGLRPFYPSLLMIRWPGAYLTRRSLPQPTPQPKPQPTLQPTPHTADTATPARALPKLQPLLGLTACSNEPACVCVSMHCVPGWKPAMWGILLMTWVSLVFLELAALRASASVPYASLSLVGSP